MNHAKVGDIQEIFGIDPKKVGNFEISEGLVFVYATSCGVILPSSYNRQPQ